MRLTATGLRDRSGPGAALPPANLLPMPRCRAPPPGWTLRLTAGSSHLAVTGTAPLVTTGSLDLHAGGAVNLALLNPILTAQGQRVRGELTLDAAVAGPATAPRITGTARLAGGDAEDGPQGIHITDIGALVQAEGDRIPPGALQRPCRPGHTRR